MILDNLNHIDNYKGLGSVYKALELLKNLEPESLEVGKYTVDETIYYSVQEYTTQEKELAEAHKHYIDVQYMVSGEESIGIASLDDTAEVVEEKPGKDCILYRCSLQDFSLKSGDFAVLYPNDLHRPGCVSQTPCQCRKIVVKVMVNPA